MKFSTKTILTLSLLIWNNACGANLRAASTLSMESEQEEHRHLRPATKPMPINLKPKWIARHETWERIAHASSLSQAIYFGNKTDLSYYPNTEYVVTDFEINLDGPVPYISTIINDGENDPIVMVAFRGKEIEVEDNTWYENVGDWLNCNWGDKNVKGKKYNNMLKAIRDSDKLGINFKNETETGCEMNEYLAKGYDDFDFTDLFDHLDECKTENSGNPCELYLVGHSQGGIYAQASALRLQDHITEDGIQIDDPFVFAFGSPAGFMDTECSLLNEEKVYNFMNLRDYDRDGYVMNFVVIDAAVTVGYDDGRDWEHLGHKFILTNDDDNLKHYYPTDTTFKLPETDYSMKPCDHKKDKNKLMAHLAKQYKRKLNNVAFNSDSAPTLDGFIRGGTCFYDDHCSGEGDTCHGTCRYTCGSNEVTSVQNGIDYAIKRAHGSSLWAAMEGSGDYQVKIRNKINDVDEGGITWNVKTSGGYKYLYNVDQRKYAESTSNKDKDVEGTSSKTSRSRVQFVRNESDENTFEIKHIAAGDKQFWNKKNSKIVSSNDGKADRWRFYEVDPRGPGMQCLYFTADRDHYCSSNSDCGAGRCNGSKKCSQA